MWFLFQIQVQVNGITERYNIWFIFVWNFRYLSGSMAARITSRLRSADKCAVRHGVSIPTKERSFFNDVSSECRRCVRTSSPPRTSSRRRRFVIRWRCWQRSRCRSGGWPRQAARWRTRGFRFKGAKWWTASQTAFLLRTIVHHQKDFVPGE